MRDSRIRVLLHKGLESHEADAALRAAERFSRFGLRVETMRDGPDDKVWMDLCRKRIYGLAFRDGPLTLYGDEPLGRPDYFSRVPNDGALLAGMIPGRIYLGNGSRTTELEGFNLYYVGAVVSAAPFRKQDGSPYRGGGPADAAEASAALELCLSHELGHSLLGREPVMKLLSKEGAMRYDEDGHCQTSGCLMQNVSSYLSLLRSAAGRKIDFCAGCADLLGGRVTEIRWYGCA